MSSLDLATNLRRVVGPSSSCESGVWVASLFLVWCVIVPPSVPSSRFPLSLYVPPGFPSLLCSFVSFLFFTPLGPAPALLVLFPASGARCSALWVVAPLVCFFVFLSLRVSRFVRGGSI
eukprot:5515720-Pyramimonas_sp.AAC.1